jgi:hypothetical protein
VSFLNYIFIRASAAQELQKDCGLQKTLKSKLLSQGDKDLNAK